MSLDIDETLLRKMKAELRKRLRAVRAAAPESACLQRSAKIQERLLALPELLRARRVALFFPMVERREVDLRGLDAALSARGIERFYPAIDQDTREMTFRRVQELSELEEFGMGFAEPRPEAETARELDVIVVPCLAVAPDGTRLGYGGGFYDRTLPRYAPPAFSVAVAFDYQLLVDLPRFAHDTRVQHIVTDQRSVGAG